MRFLLVPLILLVFAATPATAGINIVQKYPKLFKVPPKGAEGMAMLKTYCSKMGFKKGTEKNGECVLKLFSDPMVGMKIECSEIGFVAGTEKHGGCVVELFTRAKAKANQMEAQEVAPAIQKHLTNKDQIARQRLELERQRLVMERQRVKAQNRRDGLGMFLQGMQLMNPTAPSAAPAPAPSPNRHIFCNTRGSNTGCTTY